MANTEVEFLEDEQALLAWLHAHASKKDGVVIASDTQLIRELGFTEKQQRFFAAKMRLVTASVISLFVERGGRAAIRLNMPERAEARSKRYAMLVVPLELVSEITARTRAWRQERLAEENKLAIVPPPAAAKLPDGAAAKAVRYADAQRRAHERLGVRPIQPPLRSTAAQ